jgi:hypothetical protein
MVRFLGASAALVVASGAFALAACGSAIGLTAIPGDDGGSAGGASGAGGGVTVGGGNWNTTTTYSTSQGTAGWSTSSAVTSGGGWIDTTTAGSGGYGGWSDTTVGSGGYAGYGTTVGSGGYGGSAYGCIPGQMMRCPCPTGQIGYQVCRPGGVWDPCLCPAVDGGSWEQQELARLRRGIVGTWLGEQSNPWGPGCSTKISFEANGHYFAHSPNDACVVFYWGSNSDSMEKIYTLNDVLASGEGAGEIAIWFGPGNTNRGELRHVYLSPDENTLAFEVWKERYGPLVFKLMRATR